MSNLEGYFTSFHETNVTRGIQLERGFQGCMVPCVVVRIAKSSWLVLPLYCYHDSLFNSKVDVHEQTFSLSSDVAALWGNLNGSTVVDMSDPLHFKLNLQSEYLTSRRNKS